MAPKLEISGTPRAPQAPPSHSAGNLNLLRFVPGSRTVRNIAATGAALVFAAGVLYIGEGIEHELHNFGFDINIGGTNPPDSTGTKITDLRSRREELLVAMDQASAEVPSDAELSTLRARSTTRSPTAPPRLARPCCMRSSMRCAPRAATRSFRGSASVVANRRRFAQARVVWRVSDRTH